VILVLDWRRWAKQTRPRLTLLASPRFGLVVSRMLPNERKNFDARKKPPQLPPPLRRRLKLRLASDDYSEPESLIDLSAPDSAHVSHISHPRVSIVLFQFHC